MTALLLGWILELLDDAVAQARKYEAELKAIKESKARAAVPKF